MTGLLAEVTALSLAAAISPVVLMVALMLMRGQRPVYTSGFFAAGVVLTTVLLFGLGLLAIRAQRDGLEPGPLGSPIAHLCVGLMLIAGGVVLVLIRPNPHRTEEFQRRYLEGDRSWRDYLAAGVIVMITNASSFVVVIAIIHAIARGAAGRPEDAAVAVWTAIIITALPGTAPFVAAWLGGATLQARLGRLGGFAVAYGRYVMAALWIAFGAKDVAEVLLG